MRCVAAYINRLMNKNGDLYIGFFWVMRFGRGVCVCVCVCKCVYIGGGDWRMSVLGG